MRTLKIRIPKTHKEYPNILEVMTEYKRLYNSWTIDVEISNNEREHLEIFVFQELDVIEE